LREKLTGHVYSLVEICEYSAYRYNLPVKIYKSIYMAQNHDLPENRKGDIDAGKIAHGKISKEQKHKEELEAWEELKEILPKKLYKKKRDSWDKFEALKSIEAKYVRAMDNLEAMFHMAEVGAEGFKNKEFDNACGMDEKDYDLSVTYADESFKNFIEAVNKRHFGFFRKKGDLEGFLGELGAVKKKFKAIYKQVNAPWKEEYNYGM
jgi:5'-deoxynucleotidase YfbR-like HD superfamily hydrolase